MGGFFLAPAEKCSLRLIQKGPSGPKVILPDGLTDERTTGLRELDILIYYYDNIVKIKKIYVMQHLKIFFLSCADM